MTTDSRTHIAPKLMWRSKTTDRYAAKFNPFPEGSLDYYDWRAQFYRDQSERADRALKWWLLGVMIFCALGLAFDIAIGSWGFAAFMACLFLVNLAQFVMVKR